MGYEITHSDLRIRPADKKIDFSSRNPLDHHDLRVPAESRDGETEQESADMPERGTAENLLQQLALSLEEESGF